jgi:glycine/D-amino acid oxidase-like deaminating enzyme
VKEYAYWLDTLQSPVNQQSAISKQPLAIRYDAVVIGAGYTGLSAARGLARAGASVLVLERESIGWGASSRNAGQVLTGLRLEASTLVARYGETHARRLFDASRAAMETLEALIADDGIDCGYERRGHVEAAAKPAHFEAFRKEQSLLKRVFDHRVDLVPRAEQRDEIGSDAYYGLLVDQRSGALNPVRYVRGLAAAATRAGAAIATGHAVTQLHRASNAWTVSTTKGDVEARDVLCATNGYVDGALPALQRRFVPVGSYIIVTEPLGADQAASLLPRGRTAFDSKHFLHYFRLTPDRRLLFGGRAEFSQPDPQSERRAAAILRRDLARVFPQLAGASIEYAWGGNVAFTRDEMPRAGKLDGMFYAGGYGGHGIAMATYLGDQIARRMAGEPIDQPLFDDRFPPVPLYSGRPWFLPLVGAYYRVRDLIE